MLLIIDHCSYGYFYYYFLMFKLKFVCELHTAITILYNLAMTIYLPLPVRFVLPFYVFMMLINILLLPLQELLVIFLLL